VWADEGDAARALEAFEARARSDADDAATWYGLALAALRAGQPGRAGQAVQRLDELGVQSPMVAGLAMQVEQALGRTERAIVRGKTALRRYSAHRPLAYTYTRTLLNANQPAEALRFVEEQLLTWPEDAALYALKARAHTDLGQRLDAHLAQAEAHVRQGAIGAAIEQLQLAVRSGSADFHKMSIAEARLRELRAVQQRETARR
jgi:predicted Zn-dependent protease